MSNLTEDERAQIECAARSTSRWVSDMQVASVFDAIDNILAQRELARPDPVQDFHSRVRKSLRAHFSEAAL